MRHEEKYICSDRQLAVIESRLRAVMSVDSNQTGTDYRIRSLYFDTVDDRMYHESLNGIDQRSKYRLRFYNLCTDLFRMERKDTVGNLKQKYSANVGVDEVSMFVDNAVFPGDDNDLLRQVHVLQQTEGLRPVTIVDYRRTAFVCPIGNVRITLDRDIACTYRIDEFLDKNALLYPLMSPGRHVLEVKYDSVLPGYINRVLDTGSLERVSFSKYAYARSVIDGNGRKEDGYEF